MNFKQINKIEQEYRLQKRLERYQQIRPLPKPKTTYTSLIVAIVCFLLTTAIGIVVLVKNSGAVAVWLPITLIYPIFSDFYIRFVLITAVKCYQHYAKEERRRKCLCVPSCSQYAIAVLKRNFLLFAIFKIRKRLFQTCQGDDYKIDLPYPSYLLPSFFEETRKQKSR